MGEVDWAAVNAKLPTATNEDDKAKRKQMFKEFDPNGNGILSLAETDKAIRDVLKLDGVFDAKPAIMRAFQAAKNRYPSKQGKLGDDYIERKEFKFFLVSLRQYFEYFEAFSRVDKDGDDRITLAEFTAQKDKIEVWVGPIDPEEEFNKIDANKGGYILFDEFCIWALDKQLDVEDDIEPEA